MEIRRYTDDDAEGVAEAHRTSVRRVAAADYDPAAVAAWADVDAADVRASDTDRTVRYVAVEDGQVLGHADYVPAESELIGLYVHADHVGSGVGRRLLARVERDARERGLDELACESTVTARGFYERHGWEHLGETTHDVEGHSLTVHRMRKRLRIPGAVPGQDRTGQERTGEDRWGRERP